MVVVFDDDISMRSTLFFFFLFIYFLFGFVDEGLVVAEVGQDVLGQVIFYYCEVGDHWVYLLWGSLLCHYTETVLLVR